MSSHAAEFHYRLPAAVKGHQPGAHAGLSRGPGLGFAAHARLLDHPDPRRIDLRASLRDPRGDWLVRVHRQQTSVTVHALVDVSASMQFGARRPKLHIAADLVESLGYSACRAGDPAGLLAFDSRNRDDLHVPARLGRGQAWSMVERLRHTDVIRPQANPVDGSGPDLHACVQWLGGSRGLVFWVSDFHWPMSGLHAALRSLAGPTVVPVVVWDSAETRPPAEDGLLDMRDAENGQRRTLWLGRRQRAQWLDSVALRRQALKDCFAAGGLRPIFMTDRFEPEAMSRHFLEGTA